MRTRNQVIFLAAALTLAALALPAQASSVRRDTHGHYSIRGEYGTAKWLPCGVQMVHIDAPNKEYDLDWFEARLLTLERPFDLRKLEKPTRSIDITMPISEFLGEGHDMRDAVLKCLPRDNTIGIFIPSTAPDVEPLSLTVLKDGRVMKGQTTSGHD